MTGDYDALVDGDYGPSTQRALLSYQARNGYPADGILTEAELAALQTEAERLAGLLGIEPITDTIAGLSLFLPTKVLSTRSATPTGTLYYTSDNAFVFETLTYPVNGGTLQQYRENVVASLGRQNSTSVTYSTVTEDHFVVSGSAPEGLFYIYMALWRDRFVGFQMTATQAYAREGTITSVLAASYFSPTEAPPQAPAQTTPTTPQPAEAAPAPHQRYSANGERFGSILLPYDDEGVIVLDGDIGSDTPLELYRAFRERPKAETVVLNSDGGSVTAGLVIAHEVFTRSLSTLVPPGYGCYSACAYIFFAGASRDVAGELGVHQIHAENGTQEGAQYSLSDVLDSLRDFDVSQRVVSLMLRTPPDQIHIFDQREISELGINRSRGASSPVAPVSVTTAPQAQLSAQALLIEASDSGMPGATPFSGVVQWSSDKDAKGQPTLVGKATIPSRGISVELMISDNADMALPASYVIEISFKVSDTFIGGSIAEVPGVLLKNEELVQGAPLVGASARVVGNSFLFALSAAPEDNTANVNLLTSRKWMDLALIYASGKRAIFTLEKDEIAQKLFAEAFESWREAAPAQEDGRASAEEAARARAAAAAVAAAAEAAMASEAAAASDQGL